ncbi:MAG: glycosyltransferase family 2 protein [Firmicutes bacterium]|nr:glycosyltransferase family 2 protein [Bacillota bacterium]
MAKVSVIVPCHNEEEVLPLFYAAITEKAAEFISDEFEFIFVDDGSKDKTLSILREYSAADERVRYISFSRNFGKEAGMFAGLEAAKGDYIVLMDADLQHPPEYIGQMLENLKSGEYDCVGMYRVERHEGLRGFLSKKFFALIRHTSKIDLVDGATDFQMMTSQVRDAVLSLSEYNRFTKGILSWVGFRRLWLPYEDANRAAGETKWSFMGLFRYSLDGITGFSAAPLNVASVIGFIFCLAAFIFIVVIVVKTLIWGDPVAGFPTLACLILLVGGIQLLCMGILGQYMSKTYLETKRRPLFIIKETEKKK